jgi:hypothetical protein
VTGRHAKRGFVAKLRERREEGERGRERESKSEKG